MPMLNTVNDIVSQYVGDLDLFRSRGLTLSFSYPGQRTAVEKDGALRMLACLADTVVKAVSRGGYCDLLRS